MPEEPEMFDEPEVPLPKPFEPTARATDVVVVINRRLGEQAARASGARGRYRRGLEAGAAALQGDG